MKKRLTLSFIFLSIILLAILTTLLYFNRNEVDLWPSDSRVFSLSPDMGGNKPGLMVSMTSPREGFYLIADYANIFLLRGRDGSLALMQPDRSTFSTDRKGVTYNPTGLFYDRSRQLLYVANYTANNILAFEVDIEARSLVLKSEIGTVHTVSPENVSVSSDGSFLACANYDGNSVTAFDLTGEKARELWSRPVMLAHGICVTEECVYATGLRLRAIFELNRKNGHLKRRSGQMGWNPSKLDLLWPVSVQVFSPDELIVSDAHTGYIYIIDRATLTVNRCFGGNGPTFHSLNMPYAAFINNDEIGILSTYQRRVLLGKKKDLMFQHCYSMHPKSWEYARAFPALQNQRLGSGWDSYLWTKGPKVNLFGNDYILGYAHLHPFRKNLTQLSTPCSEGSLFNSTGELYFLDRIEFPEGFILFTSQRGQAYCFYRESDATYFLPLILSMDNWRHGREIYSPEGRLNCQNIWENAGADALALKTSRTADGVLKSDRLREIVFPGIEKPVFDRKFREVFRTEPGKLFCRAYIDFENGHTNVKDLNRSANIFFTEISRLDSIPMDELMLVHMLTGKTPREDDMRRNM